MDLIPQIEWSKFRPGASFFIPCLQRVKMERFVLAEARRIKVQVLCRRVVENGVYGLRVWRLDDTVGLHSSSRG
jgi:hypothetical protein